MQGERSQVYLRSPPKVNDFLADFKPRSSTPVELRFILVFHDLAVCKSAHLAALDLTADAPLG